MKVAIDERMSGEELLGLDRRLEPLHLPFTSSRRPMGVLCAVVEVSALPMLDIGQQVTLSHPIAPEFVGDDHPRRIPLALQQTPEESFGGFPVPSVLHKDVQDHAALIHGAPQVMLNALDPDEHFIEVPLVSRPRSMASQTLSMAAHGAAAPRGAERAPVR